MSATIRIGTSGFSYREWLGAFYPARLPGKQMLAYYGERMPWQWKAHARATLAGGSDG